MKQFRFALLALAVAAVTFAFTPSIEKAPTATVYAFGSSGTLMGSASDVTTLKNNLCPGQDLIICAQVWTEKDSLNHPAGTRLADIKKPNVP